MKFVHTADTHLGFEIIRTAQSDKEGRHRRAEWIFKNFVRVTRYATDIEADLFIHSGDLFNKYYIPRERLDDLIWPVLELAEAGIPVLMIPGNHERSQFPFDLFHGAKNVFVFDQPKSLCFTLDAYRVGFAGFPFIREDSRRTFLKALEESEYEGLRADFNILVTHQAFDEAIVGPVDFTFKATRPDTVSRHTIPLDFEYIAAGHIHRYQTLSHPLKPRLKFVYPGSIQRVSFAEMYEEKGFVEGEILNDRVETRFIPLPAWDMEMVEIEAAGRSSEEIEDAIRAQFWRFREDMVIRFSLTGGKGTGDYADIDFERLRAEMPPVLECQVMMRAGDRWLVR
ncbi:MAG: metallophosphoesterase [Desulfobacteraceae bacterium]|jgi:DNA repair exonuclease SbcCD nuclease subunit